MAEYDPRPPTRAELARFLPNQRLVRAFEKLFDLIPPELIELFMLVEAALIEAGTANAKASLALTRRQLDLDYIDFNENPPHSEIPRRLSWGHDDDTLNIHHKDGVVEQVGIEQYMRTENNTGSVITDGTVVGFAGVNGEIKVQPFIADGTMPALYFIGVTTHELSDSEIGKTTVYGKIHGIDTTGTTVSETWAKGDILYASVTTAGKMTNVRPSAPNEVIVIAAVLKVDATDGIIMVRPTVPLGFDYAQFSDTTDQSPAAANTAYAVTFNTTDVAHNISVVSNSRITVSQAGRYSTSITMQVTSSNSSSSTVFMWLAKNGTDIPNSRVDLTIKANGDTKPFTTDYQISLEENDYIELMWAADTTSMTLDAKVATAFAPAAPSVRLSIDQSQL